MKVWELKSILKKCNNDSDVMIAFDSGIRMDIEVVAKTIGGSKDISNGTIVLSDESDFESTSHYHKMERLNG